MLHGSGGAAVLSPGAAAPCLHLSRPRAGFLVSGRAVRLFGLAALPGAPGLEVRHCWPGRCRAGRGRGPASWCGCPRCPGGCPRCPGGCPRSVPDGLNSCDRLRTHADLSPLPPLPKHPEKASRGVLHVEVRALLAGSVPGWSRSRACLLVRLPPLPWRLPPLPWRLPPFCPRWVELMRSLAHSCGLVPAAPAAKAPGKGFAGCSSRRGAGAAGRVGAGLVEVEGLPCWCRVSGRVRTLPVTCWPGRTNHEESGSSNHKKHCKSITYAINKVDPGPPLKVP